MNSADAAKNAFESFLSKTKEVVQTAAETTKTYANQAIGKIIPGQQGAGAAGGAASGGVGIAAPGAPAPPAMPAAGAHMDAAGAKPEKP